MITFGLNLRQDLDGIAPFSGLTHAELRALSQGVYGNIDLGLIYEKMNLGILPANASLEEIKKFMFAVERNQHITKGKEIAVSIYSSPEELQAHELSADVFNVIETKYDDIIQDVTFKRVLEDYREMQEYILLEEGVNLTTVIKNCVIMFDTTAIKKRDVNVGLHQNLRYKKAHALLEKLFKTYQGLKDLVYTILETKGGFESVVSMYCVA